MAIYPLHSPSFNTSQNYKISTLPPSSPWHDSEGGQPTCEKMACPNRAGG